MNNDEEITIDLIELFSLIKDHLMIIVLITILGAAIGFGVSKFLIVPKYQASVNMIVNTRQEGSNANVTNDNINSAKNLVDTYAIIIQSNTVLNQVISNLDLSMNYSQLDSKVSVSAVNDTQVMRVAVTDTNPETARKIVEQISYIAPDAIVRAVSAGSCEVVSDVAVENNPVSPNVRNYTLIAALGGLAVSVAVIIIRELMNNNVVDDADVKKYLDLPLLGVIPKIEEAK